MLLLRCGFLALISLDLEGYSVVDSEKTVNQMSYDLACMSVSYAVKKCAP